MSTAKTPKRKTATASKKAPKSAVSKGKTAASSEKAPRNKKAPTPKAARGAPRSTPSTVPRTLPNDPLGTWANVPSYGTPRAGADDDSERFACVACQEALEASEMEDCGGCGEMVCGDCAVETGPQALGATTLCPACAEEYA